MKKVKDVIMIIIGGSLLAFSVAYFVIPNDILSGGVAGIAVIINQLFGINETITINVFMVICFILGYIFLGKEFALKTVLGSASYTITYDIMSQFPLKIDVSPLLACIFGGVIAGAGIGLVFAHNGSTGGVDIPQLIISKLTGINLATVVFMIDGAAALAGFLVFGVEEVMLGMIYIYASSAAIDRVVVPQYGEAVAVYIISDKVEELCNYIHIDLYRGTTLLTAAGGYTGNDRKVILTVVSKQEYVKLNNYIEKIDPSAFVIVSEAKEIKGEGFTYEPRV
ncbi:MAG: YitT family protein [Erysipelotrichaceae bacterium]|nr:YitT family protein [Erysipelotrichaceae bacterium]